jgi:hypothetical protein
MSVAGWGEIGPCWGLPEIRLRKAVTTIGPAPMTDDFLITKTLVPRNPPELADANSFTPT